MISSSLFASPIKRDEDIVFFPTAGRLSEDRSGWHLPIHAWVFEPEADSMARRATLAALARALGLTEDAAGSETFKARARWFLVDNERGKRVRTTLSPESLGPSGANGHLKGEITLERRGTSDETASFLMSYAARLPEADERRFTGRAIMVAQRGLSIVSDIDDTLKISEVTDKQALVANTFLNPFEAVPGMAAAYARFAGNNEDTVYHYVSSSPWQLYEPLAAFMTEAGFPPGSFHLKDFRVKDRSFLNLIKSSLETKPPIIEGLLAAFPERDFVLIGDSGELDPEIYGQIARHHPQRIRHIYIRKVIQEKATAARYQSAFAGLEATRWTLFDDPAVISP
ncbi:MAG: App1 family protein [Pseudomonadota bacterium]